MSRAVLSSECRQIHSMSTVAKPIIIATRGSALALAQANLVFDQCRAAFPKLKFEIKIIKTTGDKLQTASLAKPAESLPKGLFTKELEVALLKHRADLAVHSLKDLPSELPAGLTLGAVSRRADVRDVLIYRDAEQLRAEEAKESVAEWTPGQSQRRGFKRKISIKELPPGATVATSSTRRKAQLLEHRPDLTVVEIRGNVITRLQKLADQSELDAIVLAAAGLERLNFRVTPEGRLQGDAVPEGLLATVLEPELMLPCVGQGALGIEIREGDERVAVICERLNHFNTRQCVTAERAFLRAMGGGCQSPIAAYAEVVGNHIRLRAASFRDRAVRRGESRRDLHEPVALGEELAAELG
ncbi:MAG: hydroxymethylbilane synthase [Verrucomicrobia bacterium]|nr:MAG: hydroxymethylbilane synthase [Verrucomicrobiota bacterium]